jgi:diguanylate cyclase (GGDEF)-like protein
MLSAFLSAVNGGLQSALAKGDSEASIDALLEGIARGADVMCAAIVERADDGALVVTHSWRGSCACLPPTGTRLVPDADLRAADLAKLDAGETVCGGFSIPVAAPRSACCGADDVAVPLRRAGKTVGFIVLDGVSASAARELASGLDVAASAVSLLVQRRDELRSSGAESRVDSVTGLQTMDVLSGAIDSLIGKAAHGATEPFDLVYFDIVAFKFYNITYGFDAGDRLLRQMSQAIGSAVGIDRVARYGADNFYALVEGSRSEEAVKTVHAQLAEDATYGALVRAGIYRITGDEASAGQVVDRAKMAGDAAAGDFVRYWRRFEKGMEESLALRSYVVRRVDEAVAQGWIEAYFQPIVGTFSGKVESVEALARWKDPERGMLRPDQFIDTLERGKLVYKVDLEILRQACARIAARRAQGVAFEPVSVNFSRYDLQVDGIHETIDGILASYGVPHEYIHIEITETALVANEALIREHVTRFHERGYEVWLDDFGSGYSSLNTLQNFDFDCAKIDMAFLRGGSSKLPQMLCDVVTVSKHMGLKTLVEGVETEEQLDLLKRIGCMFVQGYYFSKPLPAQEAARTFVTRGLPLASAQERALFNDVGMTDVVQGIHPFFESEPALEAILPLAIFVRENGILRTVYANRALRDYGKASGYGSVGESDATLNYGDGVVQTIRDALRQSTVLGSVVEARTPHSPLFGAVRSQLISVRGDARAYLVAFDPIERRSAS